MLYRTVLLNAFSVCLLLGLGVANGQAVLFEQPPLPETEGENWTTHVSVNGIGFRSYDDFSVDTAGVVTTVMWRAFYWDFEEPANNPVEPNTALWELAFYANDVLEPSEKIFSETQVAIEVETELLFLSEFFGDTVPVYEFRATLQKEFVPAAGETYWFSPLSISCLLNPILSWRGSDQGNELTVQDVLPNGERKLQPGDRAFAIWGGFMGDVNCDGEVNLLDVAPFVEILSNGIFNAKADLNGDGAVDLLDVDPFISVLSGN